MQIQTHTSHLKKTTQPGQRMLKGTGVLTPIVLHGQRIVSILQRCTGQVRADRSLFVVDITEAELKCIVAEARREGWDI